MSAPGGTPTSSKSWIAKSGIRLRSTFSAVVLPPALDPKTRKSTEL
jgi:hypothetical protein